MCNIDNKDVNMIEIRHLEELVLDQKEVFLSKDEGLQRNVDFDRYTAHQQIVVVSGIRRSGKSTLLRQFAERFDNFNYINFDDERLIDFTVNDFPTLMLVFEKLNPGNRVIFIDEIQNIENWERFVRRIHDEGYKIFLTGSNAKLLSSELATHLTGRYVKIELYPFSFEETLRFKCIPYKCIPYDRVTSAKKAAVLREFDLFLKNGGFPELLKYQDTEFLKRTYDDILFRDVITRFGIREVKAFKQLAHYIFSNFTDEVSYNSLKNMLGFKSAMSVRSYISYLEESYLVFEVYKYDYSLKKQHVSNKKLYVIDNGMRNAVSFRFSNDAGKMLENLVFIELKRRGHRVFFFRNRAECDFVIEEKGRITMAVQVCFDLGGENRKREMHGIAEAMRVLGVQNGLILTYNQEDVITTGDGVRITVQPVWQWLLDMGYHDSST